MGAVLLTFMALSLAHPDWPAEKVEIIFDGSPFACMMLGQEAVAEWAAQHPARTIVNGYRCDYSRSVGGDQQAS